MKIAAMIARYLLGLGFVVFGLNAFFQFMPPPELPGPGAEFMGLMFESGYFNFVAVIKIVGGLLLLLGRFVPLGLTLLGPVLVNILLFHIAFDPAGIVMGLVFTVLWFAVLWQYNTSFRTVLSVDGR